MCMFECIVDPMMKHVTFVDNVTIQDRRENFFELDHQNLDIYGDNFTLAWRYSSSNLSCVNVFITSTDVCETNVFHQYTLNSEVYTFTTPIESLHAEFNEPALINISCSDVALKEPVRLNCKSSNTTYPQLLINILCTVKEIETIQLPLESGECNSHCINVSSTSFILILSSSPRDIMCPVYIETGSECYNVSRCSSFNNAFESPFFSICKNPKINGSFQMCFTNISEVLHGVKMFFLISTRHCNLGAATSNLYYRAIEIQVECKKYF